MPLIQGAIHETLVTINKVFETFIFASWPPWHASSRLFFHACHPYSSSFWPWSAILRCQQWGLLGCHDLNAAALSGGRESSIHGRLFVVLHSNRLGIFNFQPRRMMDEYTSTKSSDPVALSKEVVHREAALVPASTGTPAPGRDGGAFAWLQCGGSFFLFFNSWGLVNTFGTSN